MKAVVGVDSKGLYHSTLNLLARLKIEGTEVELLHVDESAPFYSFDDFPVAPDVHEIQHDVDIMILKDAEQAANRLGFTTSRTILLGPPAPQLMGDAGEHHADLICVGSGQKSPFSSLFFGSVGRALAIGAKQSVLIGKGAIAHDGPITALVTTDHSNYSNEALSMLGKLRPSGIKRLILLTVLDEKLVGGANETHIEPFREFMEEKSKKMAQSLIDVGLPAEYRIVEGSLSEAIDRQMQELAADLLIMGAQGHGFIERIHIGSASLKEVVASRHPILLLRPRLTPNA